MGLASQKEALYACRPSGHLCLCNERINYFLSKRNTNYSVITLEGVTQKDQNSDMSKNIFTHLYNAFLNN